MACAECSTDPGSESQFTKKIRGMEEDIQDFFGHSYLGVFLFRNYYINVKN